MSVPLFAPEPVRRSRFGVLLPVTVRREFPAVDAYAQQARTVAERVSCIKCRAPLCVRCLGCHCQYAPCRCHPRQCCSGEAG